MKKGIYIIIIAVILFIIFINFDSEKKDVKDNIKNTNISESPKETLEIKETKNPIKTKAPEQTKKKANKLIDGLIEKPVMNGIRTEKLGTYAYIKSSLSELEDNTLLEFAKFIKNKNYMFIIIDLGDGYCFSVQDSMYSHCKLKKDEYGDYSFGESTGNLIYVYIDSNKVVRDLDI